ncbi:MAG: hypothetical protein ACP5E5_04820 [Acidobacteriaceae bacterium]
MEKREKTARPINCATCRTHFADLLLDQPFAVTVRDAAASLQTGLNAATGLKDGHVAAQIAHHLAVCAKCRTEFEQLQATCALMDSWTAPEPSTYFDGRLHARLREVQSQQPESLWSRLRSFFLYNTRHKMRPMLAGALSLALIAASGGGTFLGHLGNNQTIAVKASPALNDLKILDKNAQALQQMDQLLDADDSGSAPPSS